MATYPGAVVMERISLQQALQRLHDGRDVWAPDEASAKALADMGGGAVGPEGGEGGNARHYHTILRSTHIFYGNDPNLKFVDILK